MTAVTLFDPPLPDGFRYERTFISPDEERELVRGLDHLTYAAFEMHGTVAKRRVAFFGRTYDAREATAPPIPPFLVPLRDRAARWAGLAPDAIVMALDMHPRD